MTKILDYLKRTMYLPVLCIVFIVLAFCLDSPQEIFYGLIKIVTSNSILMTDYLAVGGIGATLINVSCITLLNILLIHILKLRMSGFIFSGLMSITGFAFFGKNLLNTLPIYLGIFLFSLIKKVQFRNLIITILLSTGISPLVSYCIFGFGLPFYYSIPLGVSCGIIAGIMLPPLASHVIKFHQGYNIFNTGFALGILSLLFSSIFKTCGLEIETVSILSSEFHYPLLFILIGITLFYFIVSFILDPHVFKHYLPVLKRSGRLVSDYERDYGRAVVFFNISLLSFISIILLLSFNIQLNGVIFGTIITVIGFGASGLHLWNTLFVFVGSILAIYMTGRDIHQTSLIVAVFFSAGLAPISGRYGPLAGLCAGIIHLMIVPYTLSFQGGFDLYNNGFAAGFVACILIVTLETFKRQKER